MNLIDGEMKVKPAPPFSSVNQSKGIDALVCEQKKEIEVNFKKIQDVKKEREFRMNPQIYIKKMLGTKNIDLGMEVQEVLMVSKKEKPVNSIMKFYPSLNNNLKSNGLSKQGKNLGIFSYTKHQ